MSEAEIKPPRLNKKQYSKPRVKSEKIMTFGAQCNGSADGGRKASAGAPNFCNTSRLLS